VGLPVRRERGHATTTSYLIETYLPGGDEVVLEEVVVRARRAARVANDAGIAIRHVRTFLAPADELCFHVFEAATAADLARAVLLGALEHDRITEVIE
jgi:hypothetical protein